MARRVLIDAYVSVAGTDISDSVKSVELSHNVALQDSTTMGDTSMERLPGLKDWSASLTVVADEAAGEASKVLWDAHTSTSLSAIEIRGSDDAVSASNPKYTGNGWVSEINPVGGGVGELQQLNVSIVGSSDLARATS